MKKILVTFAAFCAAATVLTAGGPEPRALYLDGPKTSNGIEPSATVDNGEVRFAVTTPDYYVFLPEADKANGQAVIVCPGGGYGCVCYAREGLDVARWLNGQGVAAFVLRYRMPNGHHEIPMEDVREMFRIVRANASQWKIDPAQVGIMGFSAGGHLASTAATQFEADTRPDFAVLIYPVITMQDRPTQWDTRNNLLGLQPDAALVERYSSERQVTPQTPPVFIALSDDDEVVPTRNSTLFYDALKENGVAAELHIYPTGRHGWIGDFTYWDEYHGALSRWLGQLREGKIK